MVSKTIQNVSLVYGLSSFCCFQDFSCWNYLIRAQALCARFRLLVNPLLRSYWSYLLLTTDDSAKSTSFTSRNIFFYKTNKYNNKYFSFSYQKDVLCLKVYVGKIFGQKLEKCLYFDVLLCDKET